jgi:hypothetical protein
MHTCDDEVVSDRVEDHDYHNDVEGNEYDLNHPWSVKKEGDAQKKKKKTAATIRVNNER